MSTITRLFSLAAMAALSACATVPSGPSVMVLPGTGKTFDQFRADQAVCEHYAQQTVGGITPGRGASDSAGNSAAVGTAVGAAAGALIGATSGHPGTGAAIGAGTGLVVGGLAGTDAADRSFNAIQNRYDMAYIQCMYASGHQVPVYGGYTGGPPPPANQPPPPLPSPPPPGPSPTLPGTAPPPASNTPGYR